MSFGIIGFVGILAIFTILFLIGIVADHFKRVQIKLNYLEIVALSLPLFGFLVGVRYQHQPVTVCIILMTALLTSSTWAKHLVQGWAEIRNNDETVRCKLIILIIACAGGYLLFEGAIQIQEIIQVSKEQWNQIPESKKFFYYGFGVLLLLVAGIFGIHATHHKSPEYGVPTAKLFASIMCSIWALCWIGAMIHAFFEKIGSM